MTPATRAAIVKNTGPAMLRRLTNVKKATQPALLRSQSTAGDITSGREAKDARPGNARHALTGSAEEETQTWSAPDPRLARGTRQGSATPERRRGGRLATSSATAPRAARPSTTDAGSIVGTSDPGPRATSTTADTNETPDRL